jgi:hypothetical protein
MKDGKTDGKDLSNFTKLEKRFDKDKENTLKNTKESLQKSLKEMLKKGFTVENESDFNVFKKIMKLAGKGTINIPSYLKIQNASLKDQ